LAHRIATDAASVEADVDGALATACARETISVRTAATEAGADAVAAETGR